MNNFKKYSSYKDSEIEWLEKIPSHWELIRLGSEFEERRDKVSDKDFEALSVTKNGIVPQLENAAKSNDGDNRKGVRKGDFVINSRSDRKGSSGIAYQDGSVSLINIVLKPKSIFPKYSEYLLKSYHFIEEYYRFGHGIVADLWTTRYSEMKAMPIPLPPLPEQTAIANFLDKKTAEIKEFIALKERTIELLKERKMAIINQAVTKGLDPTVEMKDSGIEWLGEIPKHWEVKKLKYNLKRITGGGTPSMENRIFWDGDIPWFTPKDMKSDILSKSLLNITDLGLRNSATTLLPAGSLLIVVRSGILQRTLPVSITKVNSTLNQDLKALVPKDKVKSEYLFYILRGCEKDILSGCVKSIATVESIEMNDFKNFELPFTSDSIEQDLIVDFIDNQIKIFNEMVLKISNEISLITEYQQSLISEVVTGKVDVRNINN